MNEYRALTSEIQIPEEWPVDGIENIVRSLVQDVINCHLSGRKFVMTVENVSTMIEIEYNRTKPRYVFKRIKEIEDADTYRIDLLIPAKITILKRTNGGPNDKKEESIKYLPMNVKFNHPIAKLVSTNPDRHIVATIVPDIEKTLLLNSIIGSEMHDYTLRTTYRVHNIKWLDDVTSDIESGESTTESFIVDAQQISKNKWDIVCNNRLPQSQRFWFNLEVTSPWILYSIILIVLAIIIYAWIFIIQNISFLYTVNRSITF